MEIQLNDYHKKVNAQMQKSMAYWREHPLSLEDVYKRQQMELTTPSGKSYFPDMVFYLSLIHI